MYHKAKVEIKGEFRSDLQRRLEMKSNTVNSSSGFMFKRYLIKDRCKDTQYLFFNYETLRENCLNNEIEFL